MKGGINRLIGGLVVALMCVGMWGCSDDDSFKWKGRSYGYVVSLVDDSLAFLYNRRSYERCHEGSGPLGYSDCVYGGSNDGLYLVNYRKKKSIYWGDTLDYAVNFMRGFYRDSTVLFLIDDERKFGFWKIGEKPLNPKSIKWNFPCNGYDEVKHTRFRPWKNGNVLLIETKGCKYAVLDTSTGNVNELPADNEYVWLKDCEDVAYLDGNEICLTAIYEDNRYGVWLYKNGSKTDSLVWENAKWSIVSGDNVKIAGGKVFLLDHPTRLLDGRSNPLSGWMLNIIYPLNSVAPMMKMDKNYSTFIDSLGNEIQYKADELYVKDVK